MQSLPSAPMGQRALDTIKGASDMALVDLSDESQRRTGSVLAHRR